MLPEDFITALTPGAKACEEKYGIPAGFTIAQAALESGWATSRLSRACFNLFGVKADPSWHGDTVLLPTKEQDKNGVVRTEMAKWRRYKTWSESLEDHAMFLRDNPRYRKAFEHKDSIGFAQAVADAGYATDIRYAQKLISVINKHKLEAV
ncbi:MAG: glycoside hydrolase family 73 protein [Sulfuriferula sp.]